MPSCDCITEVHDACAQDTLVNAEMLGTAPASARVSFKVAFRWHAADMCMGTVSPSKRSLDALGGWVGGSEARFVAKFRN